MHLARCRPTALLTLMLALGPIALAQAAEPPVTARTRIPVRLSTTAIGQVTAATLWVTEDRGESWRKSATITRPEPSREPVVFDFQAQQDGIYGFITVASYADGTTEAGPQPGDEPAASVIVDATPPTILAFAVEPQPVANDHRPLAVTWKVRDLHLAERPVVLQVSSGGTTWTDLQPPRAAAGSDTLSVAPSARLRLVARDRVGNRARSEIWTPPAPPDSQPEIATDEAQSATAEAEPAMAETEPEEPAATPAKPMTTTTEDTSAQPEATGTPAAEVPPAAAAADTPSSDGPPEATADGAPEESGPWMPPPAQRAAGTHRVLLGEAAAQQLRQARSAAAAGEHERALLLLRTLRDSDRADTALAEELALLLQLRRHAAAAALAADAPPEAITPASRCLAARALLRLDRHDDALAALRRVPLQSDHRREAMLIQARVHLDRGERAAGIALLQMLARGEDTWAVVARSMLSKR